MELPPQTERLLRRLDGLDAPVIQVWGWPGSGRSTLLRALLAREGGAARALAPRDLDPDTVRRGVAAGARWLVVPNLPAARAPAALLGALAEVLPADRRLVFASRGRVALPELLTGLLTPLDLALLPREVVALARRVGGPRLSTRRAERIIAACDGWYRPLLLAAEAATEIPETADALAALPSVADFLRSWVLADLEPAERDGLARPQRASPGTVRRLRDELGLLVTESGRLRALRLLEPALAASGGAPPRRRAVAKRAAMRTPDLPGDVPSGVRFRLHLLGGPEVWRRLDDGTWHRLRWPLRRSLKALAFLATAPERKASKLELIEALWPDDADDVVERNFHPTLSHLRRGLRGGGGEGEPQPLRLVDGVYSLAPELGWWTDVEALEAHAERGRALAAEGSDADAVAAWEEGWRLHRGEFLEGALEPWIVERRDEQQRRHLRLLHDLAAARERLGRLRAAIDAYRAALVEDALQEPVHVALMRLYARLGRRDLVRRQYQRLNALLRDELGVEPLAETTSEYHRLMTDRLSEGPQQPASGW